MRKIIFVLVLFVSTAHSQSLYRIVNGVRIIVSQQDSALLVQEWLSNRNALIADSIDSENSFAPVTTVFLPMVGKSFTELTTAQKTNIVEAIMWKLGIINRQRKIKTLDQWLNKQ